MHLHDVLSRRILASIIRSQKSIDSTSHIMLLLLSTIIVDLKLKFGTSSLYIYSVISDWGRHTYMVVRICDNTHHQVAVSPRTALQLLLVPRTRSHYNPDHVQSTLWPDIFLSLSWYKTLFFKSTLMFQSQTRGNDPSEVPWLTV